VMASPSTSMALEKGRQGLSPWTPEVLGKLLIGSLLHEHNIDHTMWSNRTFC
jgi:hypothetical protein